ncbi:MAG TPA: hypothetical protein VG937_37330 [Polyangiaceae bacterium]|jgi:hypothetical protein|nr:hypothetical protein [Polyangiaceae bacterium]
MRATFAISALALCAACARPPSSVPLGGNEWVPREPHSDRRAPGSVEQSERVASAPSPAPAGTATSSASAESPPKVASGKGATDLHFDWEPFTRGATIVVDTRYAIHAQLSTRFQGMATDQKAEVSAHEKIEVRVTEASGGDVRELEVNYVESESVFNLGDTPSDVDSNKGKRYRVTLEQGSARVKALSGSSDADAEKGVLFDLATVTGFTPLVRPHLPATLQPGWRTRLDSAQIATVFGRLDTLKLEGAWLTLRGLDNENPEIARFDCGLPVRFERDGLAFSVELKGSCTARPRDTRPLEVSLSGPLRIDMNAAMSAASSISGTLEAKITHSYRK